MLQVFRQAGLPRRTPPPLTPGCTAAEASAEGISPTITSPLRGVSYALRIGRPEQHAIALTASVGADANQIFWFADDRYIGKASRGRSLSWAPPGPGRYALRAVDDAGRSDTRQLIVSATP
jgi:penicillin-binding protein 1C